MFGAPSINSTNIYPNLDLWERLDPQRKYRHICNRYSHSISKLQTEEETSFHPLSPESIEARLNINDLHKVGADYILATQPDMDNLASPGVTFKKLYDEAGIKIYSVSYSTETGRD